MLWNPLHKFFNLDRKFSRIHQKTAHSYCYTFLLFSYIWSPGMNHASWDAENTIVWVWVVGVVVCLYVCAAIWSGVWCEIYRPWRHSTVGDGGYSRDTSPSWAHGASASNSDPSSWPLSSNIFSSLHNPDKTGLCFPQLFRNFGSHDRAVNT